jgi:hypothetical protein
MIQISILNRFLPFVTLQGLFALTYIVSIVARQHISYELVGILSVKRSRRVECQIQMKTVSVTSKNTKVDNQWLHCIVCCLSHAMYVTMFEQFPILCRLEHQLRIDFALGAIRCNLLLWFEKRYHSYLCYTQHDIRCSLRRDLTTRLRKSRPEIRNARNQPAWQLPWLVPETARTHCGPALPRSISSLLP